LTGIVQENRPTRAENLFVLEINGGPIETGSATPWRIKPSFGRTHARLQVGGHRPASDMSFRVHGIAALEVKDLFKNYFFKKIYKKIF